MMLGSKTPLNRGWKRAAAWACVLLLVAYAVARLFLYCAYVVDSTRQCPLEASLWQWPDVKRGPLLLADHAPQELREDKERIPATLLQPEFAACQPNAAGATSAGNIKLRLLIGILSGPGNAAQRQAQRESWLAEAPVASPANCLTFQSPRVRHSSASSASSAWAAVFIIGLTGDAAQDAHVRAEASQFNDILLLDHRESYGRIAFKTLAFLDFADRMQRALATEFVMKTDDDTFVNVGRLLAVLEQHADPNLYWGKLWPKSKVMRRATDKQKVDQLIWPECLGSIYPPFMSGSGYVLGHALVHNMMALQRRCVDERGQGDSRLVLGGCFYTLEDIQVTVLVHRASTAAGTAPVLVACSKDQCFTAFRCKENAIFIHNTSPDNMRRLHNNLQSNADLCTGIGKDGSNKIH